MASLVPDEIIYKHSDYSVRCYETALMFIDVSGFTDLCETYTKAGQGGPSRLTQVLNLYIGAMVQEILTHKGDVLKFSGDAFLCMWKKSPKLNMQDVVHTAIDCGLLIQKNYGRYITDVGVVLKVKIAISAGLSHFSIIGGHEQCQSHYVIVGQPVWDVKMAEYMSTAGDVLTSASAWMYVNESEYCTQPCGDGRHTKVLGVGATWKRVQKLHSSVSVHPDPELLMPPYLDCPQMEGNSLTGINYREFSLRPALITAMRSDWWSALRRYMVPPIIRAVDNDEPMDFLTEIRHVVVVFLNIITRSVTEDVLIEVVDNAYKIVCCVTAKTGGLVNKVSMFDKDMMFLMVFGLRGLKHEDEAQNALLCANKLKEHLNDVNITTVSIGVTSGSTYCGVVGHVLRREYTVIGSAVNKAARLMMAYPNKVTCDKETFLRSKLDQNFFKLMEAKILKGFSNPGPIYEFNRTSAKRISYSHPILGREEELQVYQTTLMSAIEQYSRKFTRYRDHKFGVAIIGSRLSGKTRLMVECINITPKFIEVDHIILTEKDSREPFKVIRLIMGRLFKGIGHSSRENRESRIRYTVDMTSLTPLEIFAVNTVFDCRFPLPEHFEYHGDILQEYQVKVLMQNIFESSFKEFRVIAIGEAQRIDEDSWKLIILMLQNKIIFLLLTLTDEDSLSPFSSDSLSNHMIVKVHIAGIDRRYLSALACQLLDVQAVPSELDKVIESASDGLPGWIQNFLICLVQREQLTMVTVPRSQALDIGALIPPSTLLKKSENKQSIMSESFGKFYKKSDVSIADEHQNDIIQMAVLSKYYNFEDVKVDMKMDVLILKTYDSLTPFEKMLLKCGSVLGDVFSRRMLNHLMQCDSQRKIAQAVAKLFSIRVLECEGGDFTRDYSRVLVHPAPVRKDASLPFCFCMGIKQLPNCGDLPKFAFCGYMKFRHTLFRTTTYDLLTESQKGEMHTRALLYLERYTRKCVSCGAGCFSQLFGLRCDDGLRKETDELKLTHEQIRTMNAETKISEGNIYAALENITDIGSCSRRNSDKLTDSEADLRRVSRSMQHKKDKKIPSFSSVDLNSCECMPILLAAYSQAIGHCHWAGDHEKLFDTFLEYADLSILNNNTPRAIHLLAEVETMLIKDRNLKATCAKWIYDSKLARIYSLRGACLLECGDVKQARENLFDAMKLFSDPFPVSQNSIKLQNCKKTFSQLMALYFAPRMYIATESGLVGDFYDKIALTLNRLFKLFTVCKEMSNAALAAKWSLNYALKTDSNFRLMCMSYGNMISVYRQMKKFRLCRRLETKARELCQRKRGRVDIMEVYAVGHLYTNIFLYNVQRGNKLVSLEFGLSVLRIMTSLSDVRTRESLIFWLLELLLTELRIQQMVSIMKEFVYLNEHYDVSSEAWYYYHAMAIYLDTGYCVESYNACETFFMEKGEMFLRSKTPEAAWNFFACMWLFTIRVGLWEKSIMWNEKIEQIQHLENVNHEYYTSLMLRLVEGYLIDLVRELNNRNIKNIINIAKTLRTLFAELDVASKHSPIFRSRYYLFSAYYHYIKRNKQRAFGILNKATQCAKKYSDKLMIIWIEHNRLYWKRLLNPRLENYWAEHVESDTILNYKSFDTEMGRKIIPYTLPLPKIF
ncbi:adenylate cyclase type 10-like [Colias croceus]|uniref:adenylate cyclase type 10-like n=1 Tax=Colias crocea TaxID=72248 RepID=UPI001E27BA94|nr:adenylate cyclase type 10-like [Colias croceus]